jgi:hypothetical protein
MKALTAGLYASMSKPVNGYQRVKIFLWTHCSKFSTVAITHDCFLPSPINLCRDKNSTTFEMEAGVEVVLIYVIQKQCVYTYTMIVSLLDWIDDFHSNLNIWLPGIRNSIFLRCEMLTHHMHCLA